MKRIGVFVCHCGINIAGVVDPKEIAEELSHYLNVCHNCKNLALLLIRIQTSVPFA